LWTTNKNNKKVLTDQGQKIANSFASSYKSSATSAATQAVADYMSDKGLSSISGTTHTNGAMDAGGAAALDSGALSDYASTYNLDSRISDATEGK
jgi:hypothetical protein